MTTYDNTNSGILKRNDKGDNPKRPDYKGSINANGVEYWVSAWVQEGKEGSKLAGQKYLSLKLEAKEEQAPAEKKPNPTEDMDDDIPF